MRILHLYPNVLPASTGGVETFIDQLCTQTQAAGCVPEVLSLSAGPAARCIRYHGYRVYQAKRLATVASTALSCEVFPLFKRLSARADLIHYHFPYPLADCLHFAARVQKPCVMTYHSDIVKQRWLGRLYRPLMYRFLAQMDAIIATSPQYAASSDVLRSFAHKVSVIPIGVGPRDLCRGRGIRDGWHLPPRFFLCVGALRYYKGLSFLITALKGTPCHVVLAGDGPFRQALDQQIKKEGLQEQVTCLGQVTEEEKHLLLERSEAFVFPSHLRSEAFGIALAEAAQAGKAMISCDIKTGTSFINRHQETGLVVKPACAEALREAMCFMWHHPAQVKRWGAAAKTHAAAVLSLSAMTSAYLDLTHRVLCNSRGGGVV